MNTPARPVAPSSASWTPASRVSGSTGGVLAPEKPAQRLETIEHLDFDHDPCELVLAEEGEIGEACPRMPATSRLVSSLCDHHSLICGYHADLLSYGIHAALEVDVTCSDCGRVESLRTFRVVPL